MAKVPNKGAPQFTSRALRPGMTDDTKKPSFDLGSIKGPVKVASSVKAIKPFKGRPSPRGK